MPGENVYDWSTTAATNANADSLIGWAEGMARAAVNDSARSMMAAIAKYRNLVSGAITTGGTANAQTFSSGMSFAAVPTGFRVLLKIGASNTGSTTLNMDGIAAVTIKTQLGADLVGGQLVAGAYAEFRYDGTNWILLSAGAGNVVRVQQFTASGTYTPHVNMVSCIIEAWGAGGGGGGTVGALGWALEAGGGGAGGHARTFASRATVGTSQAVTIGAGGTGATGVATGSTGGTTSVGSLCAATGGSGGTGGGSAAAGQAGSGGSGSLGDVLATGNAGQHGRYDNSTTSFGYSTAGGSSSLGGVAATSATGNDVSGAHATANSGSGGGGACSFNTLTTITGGTGGSGRVIISEFCTS